MCACVISHFSHVRLCVTLWTVACEAPLSMGLLRQAYWSGCCFLLLGIFLTQESNPPLLSLLHCRQILNHLSNQGIPEYWSGLPCPPLGDLPNPRIEPGSPKFQADSLPAEPQGKSKNTGVGNLPLLQGIFLTQGLN